MLSYKDQKLSFVGTGANISLQFLKSIVQTEFHQLFNPLATPTSERQREREKIREPHEVGTTVVHDRR